YAVTSTRAASSMACRTLARACSRSSSLVCMGIPHQSQRRYTKQYIVDRGLSSGSCSPDETATLLVVADTPVLVPSCPAHPSSPTPSGAARLSAPQRCDGAPESRYAESALEGWGRVTGKMRKSFQGERLAIWCESRLERNVTSQSSASRM